MLLFEVCCSLFDGCLRLGVLFVVVCCLVFADVCCLLSVVCSVLCAVVRCACQFVVVV